MTHEAGGAAVADAALFDRARGGDVAAQVELAESLSAAGEGEAAASWLAEASGRDAYATALLGAWQIYAHNVPSDRAQGLERLHRAAHAGESAACALLADLHAGGIAVAQDWGAALDWLTSAARMGNARALTQLAILQPGEERDPLRTALLWGAASRSHTTAQVLLGRLLTRAADAQQVQAGRAWLHLARRAGSVLVTEADAAALGPTTPAIDLRGETAIDALPWQLVRERIDLTAWLRPPGPEVVCSEEPLIKGFMNVAPRPVCDYLIGLSAPLMRRAQVNDIHSGRSVHHMRTNSDATIGPGNSDVLLRLVDQRIALAAGIPVENQESTAILRYRSGETYENHFDFIDPRVPGFLADIQTRGQRVATALVYLNDDYQGGATNFPKLRLALRGKVGDAIVWRNVAGDGSPEPRSLHAGMPPTQGEKWVLSKWIRSRAQPHAAPA